MLEKILEEIYTLQEARSILRLVWSDIIRTNRENPLVIKQETLDKIEEFFSKEE